MRRGPSSNQQGPSSNQQNRQGQSNQPQHGGQQRQNRGRRGGQAFTGPMDHSYRNQGSDNGSGGNRGRMGRGGRQQQPQRFFQQPAIEPLGYGEEAAQPKIFAFVNDLFFLAKIQETARKLNIKVEFVKSDKEIFDQLGENGDGKPSLIIFDLNSANAKPQTIHKLKSKLKKGTSIIGFLSHLQGDLKMKALEAGCDMVVPRSAFSQNLPQLLRRHAVSEQPEAVAEQEQGSF
jgi:hypothetical protein